MPAIQPARLKFQIAGLRDTFSQPNICINELHSIFRIYGTRVQRPGKPGGTPNLLDTYDVPPPVMRGVLAELKILAIQEPVISLKLVESLWVENYREFRHLAAYLLGQLPNNQSNHIIYKLEEWFFSTPDREIRNIVFDVGLSNLVKHSPEMLLEWAGNLITEKRNLAPNAALVILLKLVNEPQFENIPSVIRMIGPLLRNINKVTWPEMLEVLVKLIEKSPRETAFTLKKNLQAQDNLDSAWVIRQVLDKFPTDLQSGLKAELRNHLSQ